MKMEENKLDNPVWYSLNETHNYLSLKFTGIHFYNPDYCSFGGSINIHNSVKGLNEYSTLTESFYVVGERPILSEILTLNKNLVCNQMILKKPINIEIADKIIELESKNHKTDLFDLVNLVQPGYFRNKTADLGRYFGIFKNDQLIAVTGERMKMNEFTEVSAVVTHPDHTGKGYAKQLIAHTTNQIFNENKTPYLHVAESNIIAIKLYEKIGFTTRRKISFWNIKTNNQQQL